MNLISHQWKEVLADLADILKVEEFCKEFDGTISPVHSARDRGCRRWHSCGTIGADLESRPRGQDSRQAVRLAPARPDARRGRRARRVG